MERSRIDEVGIQIGLARKNIKLLENIPVRTVSEEAQLRAWRSTLKKYRRELKSLQLRLPGM